MQADSTAEVIAHPQLGTLQTLPPEIVDDVLVLLAETGYAVSIANLASTCRRLWQLVYDPLDAHLWRRIFLTTFDDPRTRGRKCCCYPRSAHLPHNVPFAVDDNALYDWCGRFTSRIQAANHLQTRTPAYHEPGHHELRSGIKIAGTTIKRYDYTHTLRALLSVLAESLPVPPKPDRMDVVVGVSDTLVATSRALPHLPLSEAANESPVSPMVVAPSQPQSKNVKWIQEILKRGLPRELLGRYATGTQELDWLVSEESTLLHKLIAHLGFPPLRCEQLPGPNRRHRRRWRLSSQYQWFQLTRVDQYNLARYISQTRVFSMNYLSAERNWGPFLRVDLLPDSGSSPSSAIDPYPLYHAKHSRRTVSEVDSDPESDDDADYQDDGEGGGEGSVSEGSDDDEDYVPPEPPAEMMSSHQLYPDWVHLAAIRIVVEAHLADHPDWDTIKQALQSWNGLRAGVWTPNIRPEPSMVDNSFVEWDWAGAEGVWQ